MSLLCASCELKFFPGNRPTVYIKMVKKILFVLFFLQIVNVVLLPLISIFLFLVSNCCWIFELLICMSMAGPTENAGIETDPDSTYKNVIKFAADKAKDSAKEIDVIKSISPWKKVFFSLHKICFVGFFLLWQTMVIGCYFSFNGFENELYLKITMYSFIGLSVLANCHLVLLVVTIDVMAPLVACSLLLYPCCVMLCFQRKSRVTTDCATEDVSN